MVDSLEIGAGSIPEVRKSFKSMTVKNLYFHIIINALHA